ncbi:MULTISPECIES: hypothetical protein [unclassified Streptomyces]|uniref:hypothetical protein n=1 Tax=unclassified Streptomyces TaxID=2593676 RepID=UPI00344E7229
MSTSETPGTTPAAPVSHAHPQIAEAPAAMGLQIEVRRFPDATRTAAGTPHTVFPLAPKTLIAHAGATVADVRGPAT